MSDEPVIWPSVDVTPLKDSDDCIWGEGKPWCPRHHVVLIRAENVAKLNVTGSHVCAECMRQALAAHKEKHG